MSQTRFYSFDSIKTKYNLDLIQIGLMFLINLQSKIDIIQTILDSDTFFFFCIGTFLNPLLDMQISIKKTFSMLQDLPLGVGASLTS